jgi:hypothetical protein
LLLVKNQINKIGIGCHQGDKMKPAEVRVTKLGSDVTKLTKKRGQLTPEGKMKIVAKSSKMGPAGAKVGNFPSF